MMKALGFFEFGNIDKMQIFDTEIPKPQATEVLVEIKASALNHLDIWVRKGIPGAKIALPHISGSDAAGVIVECGKAVTHLSVGARVVINPGVNLKQDEYTLTGEHSVSPYFKILGEQLPGTHTQYIAVPTNNILLLPDECSFVEAAASGLVCLTAWRMLVKRAKIQLGEKILVIGAGGGVNGVAIQIAKLTGCHVTALTSTSAKMAKAYELGADVVLNYHDETWPEQLLKQTNKAGFDVVIDNVGAATLAYSLRLVKRGGRIITVGNTSGPITELDIRYIFFKQISLIGSTMGSPADFESVMQLVFNHKIKTPISDQFPLQEGVLAMKLLEQGEQFGKIILTRN